MRRKTQGKTECSHVLARASQTDGTLRALFRPFLLLFFRRPFVRPRPTFPLRSLERALPSSFHRRNSESQCHLTPEWARNRRTTQCPSSSFLELGAGSESGRGYHRLSSSSRRDGCKQAVHRINDPWPNEREREAYLLISSSVGRLF